MSVDFSNEPLSIEQLPQYQQVKLQPLASQYMIIVLLKTILYTAILVGFISFVYFVISPEGFTELGYVISIVGLKLISGIYLTLYRWTFLHRGYAIREKDILYTSGILAQTTIIVPIRNIRHTQFSQGFWERKLGLAAIECFTAGSNTADVSMYGLPAKEVLRIQEYIQAQIKSKDSHEINL